MLLLPFRGQIEDYAINRRDFSGGAEDHKEQKGDDHRP
jgi:hypothetical protein